MKGCICLDIDGTLTADPYHLSAHVIHVLKELSRQGWMILFVTGRLYSFAYQLLRDISFPYVLAVQNGADLWYMPEKKRIARTYLSSRLLPLLEMHCASIQEDLIIYAGPDKGDFCYYRPERFSKKMQEHLRHVESLSATPWQACTEFDFPKEEHFPLIKMLGTEDEMHALAHALRQHTSFEASTVKDPLSQDVHLTLVTGPHVHKGSVIKTMRSLLPKDTIFIAAGDDRNDIPMLLEADFAIVMNTAHESLWQHADLLAESAAKEGIIDALLLATSKYL